MPFAESNEEKEIKKEEEKKVVPQKPIAKVIPRQEQEKKMEQKPRKEVVLEKEEGKKQKSIQELLEGVEEHICEVVGENTVQLEKKLKQQDEQLKQVNSTLLQMNTQLMALIETNDKAKKYIIKNKK